MFVFDSETLRHLLEQIKVQIDKKISVEQYAIKAQETDEDALIVGHDIQLNNPLIQDLIINKNVTVEAGDKVLIRSKVLSEANYTQEEKEIVQGILEYGGLEEMLDARLDGLDLEVITKEEYVGLVEENGLDANKLYIVTDKEVVALEIDNYVTQEEYDKLAALKVDKVTYINSNNETVEKVLSTNDFTETYAAIVDFIADKGGISGLVIYDDIIDELTSEEAKKPLSARQGKILKEEYLGNMKHQYISQEDYDSIEEKEEDVIYHIEDAETLYGLTEEQMMHLKAAYEFSLRDLSQSYAKREEVYQARRNLDGRFFSSLSERLWALDDLANTIVHDTDNISDVIVGRYGVQFDFEEQEATRLFNAVGKESADFDYIYPWSQMKRCNMVNGEVVAYEGEEGYIEDGSNGDVMVEIPKFWYKVVPVKLEDAASGEGQQIAIGRWTIADRPMETYKVHPAFIRNGKEVDRIYVGAFEASVYDVSAGAFLLNNEAADIDNDYLVSVSGALPVTGENFEFSVTNASEMVKRRNYVQIDIFTLSALQLLSLIEHNSFDSQSVIGMGHVSADGSKLRTGDANSIQYRGIENLWGNVYSFVTKINIIVNSEKDCIQITDQENTVNLSYGVPIGSGFIDRIGYDSNYDFCFLPTRLTGASNLGLCDYCNATALKKSRILLIGGCSSENIFNDINKIGFYCYNYDWSKTQSNNNVGARIQFYK